MRSTLKSHEKHTDSTSKQASCNRHQVDKMVAISTKLGCNKHQVEGNGCNKDQVGCNKHQVAPSLVVISTKSTESGCNKTIVS